jgi:titin
MARSHLLLTLIRNLNNGREPSSVSTTTSWSCFSILCRKEPEPEVIYLKHVERSARSERREEETVRYSAPQFTTSLHDVAVNEGERARLEARVEPAADPSLKVDWYFNGQPITASSRVNYICQFGYVSLEMLGTTMSDAGQYTVELRNESGKVSSSARLTVRPKKELEPEVLARQQTLRHTETHVQQQRKVESEPLPSPPEFVKKLHDLQPQAEGSSVHLEAQVYIMMV